MIFKKEKQKKNTQSHQLTRGSLARSLHGVSISLGANWLRCTKMAILIEAKFNGVIILHFQSVMCLRDTHNYLRRDKLSDITLLTTSRDVLGRCQESAYLDSFCLICGEIGKCTSFFFLSIKYRLDLTSNTLSYGFIFSLWVVYCFFPREIIFINFWI